MATQKCPKCKSNNIRHGYRPTPILLKIVFHYNLLCNNCNLEFRGFAIPGTVSRKGKKRKTDETNSSKNNLGISNLNIQLIEESNEPIQKEADAEIRESQWKTPRNKVRKRVKVKLNRV